MWSRNSQWWDYSIIDSQASAVINYCRTECESQTKVIQRIFSVVEVRSSMCSSNNTNHMSSCSNQRDNTHFIRGFTFQSIIFCQRKWKISNVTPSQGKQLGDDIYCKQVFQAPRLSEFMLGACQCLISAKLKAESFIPWKLCRVFFFFCTTVYFECLKLFQQSGFIIYKVDASFSRGCERECGCVYPGTVVSVSTAVQSKETQETDTGVTATANHIHNYPTVFTPLAECVSLLVCLTPSLFLPFFAVCQFL